MFPSFLLAVLSGNWEEGCPLSPHQGQSSSNANGWRHPCTGSPTQRQRALCSGNLCKHLHRPQLCSTEAQETRFKTKCVSQCRCWLETTSRLGRFIGLCFPWGCFEQTTDWEDQKEGKRDVAVNQCSVSNSWGQKAGPAERTRETSSPRGRPGVTSCAHSQGPSGSPWQRLSLPSPWLRTRSFWKEKALTSSGLPCPPLSKHREFFFQVIVALLLVILFIAFFQCAISSPDTNCVTPVLISLEADPAQASTESIWVF